MDWTGNHGVQPVRLTTTCQVHEWHAHQYDHDTVILAGKGEIQIQGEEPRVVTLGDVVRIPAGAVHQIKALEVPLLFQCRFLHRNGAGEPVPTFEGNVEAFR